MILRGLGGAPVEPQFLSDRLKRFDAEANVLVEIRQDLISARHDAEAWGERLAAALRDILADPGIQQTVEEDHERPQASKGQFSVARDG